MKILLIGANGQLAQDLQKLLAREGRDEVVALTHAQLEIRDAAAVEQAVAAVQPECIINTAAFHKVDLCEDEPETTFAVNEGGVRHLAQSAKKHGARLVQFSTDYVFDGRKRSPYVESDEALPLSVYGKSRLAGERAVQQVGGKFLIVRTCGLYGHAGSQSKAGNFVQTMLKLGRDGRALRVVNDQVCTPTATHDLAQKLLPLLRSGANGLFHMTNTGECSWFEFAKEIFRLAGVNADVSPCTTAEYNAKAARPAYSVLDNHAFRAVGFTDFRHWKEALREYIHGAPR